MLIPRFSLRTLVIVMTAAAVVSCAGAFAVRGHHWAIAFSVALLSLVLTLLLHAAFFLVAWVLSYVRGGQRLATSANFPRHADLPPQLIRPLDPE
jgi:hypothetical protein